MRRSRATTLLNTTTTQNVACPMMIVSSENGIPLKLIAVFSAMPGQDARQRDRQHQQNEIDSAAEEPELVHGERRRDAEHQRDRGRAQRRLDRRATAPSGPRLPNVTANQCSVKPDGGQDCSALLNA